MKKLLYLILLIAGSAYGQITPAQDTTLITGSAAFTPQNRFTNVILSGVNYRIPQFYNSLLGKYDTYVTTKYLRAFYAPLVGGGYVPLSDTTGTQGYVKRWYLTNQLALKANLVGGNFFTGTQNIWDGSTYGLTLMSGFNYGGIWAKEIASKSNSNFGLAVHDSYTEINAGSSVGVVDLEIAGVQKVSIQKDSTFIFNKLRLYDIGTGTPANKILTRNGNLVEEIAGSSYALSTAAILNNTTGTPEAKTVNVDHVIGDQDVSANGPYYQLGGGLVSVTGLIGTQIAFGKSSFNNAFAFVGSNSRIAWLSSANLTGNKRFYLPDVSDKILATIDGNQTFTSAKMSPNIVYQTGAGTPVTDSLAVKIGSTGKLGAIAGNSFAPTVTYTSNKVYKGNGTTTPVASSITDNGTTIELGANTVLDYVPSGANAADPLLVWNINGVGAIGGVYQIPANTYLTPSLATSTYQPLNAKLTSISTLANASGALTNNGSGVFNYTTYQSPITFGTGVQTALGINIGSAGAPILFNGAGGTPSSITLTNASGTAPNLVAGAASTTPYTGISGLPVINNWATASLNQTVPNLGWTNFGDNFIIRDFSNGVAPGGASKSNTDADVPWATTYPSLMGWNGTNTYGVRVDRARAIDSQGSYATRSSGLAEISNNLSDLANAATARTNLGLGNVDNTSDASKPVSAAQQTAIDAKVQNSLAASTTIAPSATAVNTALGGKQASLGYTAEDVANKKTSSTMLGTSDTFYPTDKRVKDYVDNAVAGTGAYSEGTWTPTATTTLSSALGRYTKIGNMVYFSGSVNVGTNSSGSTFILSGLPFTSSVSSVGALTFSYQNVKTNPISGEVGNSGTSINFYYGTAVMQNIDFSNGTFRFTGSYSTTN